MGKTPAPPARPTDDTLVSLPMRARPALPQPGVRILRALVLGLLAVGAAGPPARGQVGPAEGREGLVELGKDDPRLKGHYAPKGFKVQVVASEPAIVDPTGMAFADDGSLYVAEWRNADRMYDTHDTLKLPEGGRARIMRRRKATTDVVKRLRDTDGDGVYDASEVVVDGAEMPSAIFPWKNSLYLTCVGRLERWSDEDGDGRFETRTVLADGFCGFYHHWLSGMVLNADGWFYLTAGDNDNHVVGSDGSRVEVSRCGGVFRGKLDGSRMNLFAIGFRNPYRNLAFNGTFDPFLVDNDQEDGSKFQGCRLINPVEGGDYGWRLRPGAPCCQADFDRGAVNGELPGKLPIVAKTGRGAPAGLIVYDGVALPDAYRDLVIYPDVFRKLVRGYRVKPQGGANVLDGEVTLMTADDDLFRPCQAVVGPDGALYVLDWRSNSGGAGRLWGDGKYGRLYKISWEGDGRSPALALKESNWRRVTRADDKALFDLTRGRDFDEARRALREIVARGESQRTGLLAQSADRSLPLHARLLGLQGARQLWNPTVEAAMVATLDDPSPEVRRLAAQAINWEPLERRPNLVPALVAHLNDPDGRSLRDVALAIGRHGWSVPFDAAPTLLAWLLKNPKADVVTRDAFVRALESLGEPGVEEVAKAVRERSGGDRAAAVAVFNAFRTEPAAKRLPALATLDDVPDRLALILQFKDVPLNIPVATQGLADWVAAHPGIPAAEKVAALDVCRLAGNPAPNLVLALLDDADESVRLAATELAAQARTRGGLEKLLDRVAEPARSARERAAIARALRQAGPSAFPALEKAYKAFADDPEFLRVALRSLADADRERATPLAESALASDAPSVRAEAAQILGESPQSARRLARAFLDGRVGRPLLPSVLAALRKYPDAETRASLAEIEKAASQSTISAADLKQRVENGGDAWRGLAVYLRETGARCYTCHKIETFGGAVGPALTGAHQALSVDKLVESLLEPSKEIKEGYEAYKLALKDGRVLTGIKVSQDEQAVVLRDANGQETRVPAADVEEMAKDPLSLMPVGLVQDYAPEELADLVAFLKSPAAQDTLKNRTRVDHVQAIGPFDAVGDATPGPAPAQADDAQAVTGQDGQTLSWAPLDTSSGGTFQLRGQFGPKPGRMYLRFGVRSEGPQEAALRFGFDGETVVFVNGEAAAKAPARGTFAVASDLARVALKDGWNTLVVAVDRSPRGDLERAAVELDSARPVEFRAAPARDGH